MTHETMVTNIRKYIIWVLVIVIGLFSLSQFVLSADVWDRPVYSVNYTPQFMNISNELNILQQQLYNETIHRIQNDSYLNNSIYYMNQSIYVDIDLLYNYINSINYSLYYLTGVVDELIMNMSTLGNQILILNDSINNLTQLIQQVNLTIKQPSGQYIEYNSTNFWINESKLNSTINNISKNKKNIYSITLNGTNSIISNITISYLITEIDVFTNSSSYRLQVTEYPSNSMIERDRIPHNRDWLIEKNYVINSPVNITVQGTGIFNVQIQYISNGVQ
jgi:hypothetical protein